MTQHQDELKRIFDAVYGLHPMGAVMYGLDNRVMFVNDMARALYGQNVPLGSVLEHAVMAPGRLQGDLLELARRGVPITLAPYELVPPSGFMHEEQDSHWLREYFNPVLHPETRQHIALVCLIEDCTIDVFRDMALKQAMIYIREMGNASPFFLVVVDQQQEIQTTNQLAEVLSGYSQTEMKGQNFLQLMISEEDQMIMGHYLLDIQTGEAEGSVECPLLGKDGSRLTLRWRYALVPDIGTELKQVMLIGQYVGQGSLGG